ncbi:histidine phosphatase family protein [Sulfurimonas sp. HSL-1716]|uniref:histidine phosphatase family protein n=1 Tax=Hydrocurvibacter sulfurireducens TaxID=3131937 RepID=UPI0031F8884C
MMITLIRHADVQDLYKMRYNGHIDISLSSEGEKQAQKLAEHFKDAKFDGVFCSDLKRARQTLAPFALQVEPVFTEDLREKSWGRHEGMSFDEIIQSEEFAYEDFMQWVNALDGEDYEAYIRRVKEFFLDYLPSLKKKNILAVTHAGVIRVLISIIDKIGLEEAFCIRFDYSSYIILDINTMKFSKIENFSL